MRGQRQTDFSPGTGNALQACVASLLELPMEDVPNFIAADAPYDALHAFLAARGLGFTKLPVTDEGALAFPVCPADAADGAWCIVAGPSPRGDHKHAVVGRARGSAVECVWDPHPDETMLAGPAVWCGVLVALAPWAGSA